MKKMVAPMLTGLCLSLSFPVLAETASHEAQCEEWSQRGGSFMVVRQMNTPIHEAMKETIGNVTRGLLLTAYQEPVHDTFEQQQEAIYNFRIKIYEDCMAQFD